MSSLEKYLKKPHVLLLLNAMFVEGKDLHPVSYFDQGFRYPFAEQVLDVDPSEIPKLVDELANAGLLKKKPIDKVPACPKCRASVLMIRFVCPRCKSFSVEKKALLEHVRCGYINIEDRFERRGETFICPSCKLAAEDVKRIGIWYFCTACGSRFDRPTELCLCQLCGARLSVADLDLVDVCVYSLTDEAKGLVQKYGFAPLAEELMKIGYSVELSGRLEGASMIPHTFDLVLRKARETIVVDVSIAEDEVGILPLVSLFTKAYDVKPSKAILLAVPKLNEEARKLCSTYGLEAIEGQSFREIVKKAVEALS